MTEEQYAEQEAFADSVEAALPAYVSHRARLIAIEAFDAVHDAHPEDKTYELAIWFDAVMALVMPPAHHEPADPSKAAK